MGVRVVNSSCLPLAAEPIWSKYQKTGQGPKGYGSAAMLPLLFLINYYAIMLCMFQLVFLL